MARTQPFVPIEFVVEPDVQEVTPGYLKVSQTFCEKALVYRDGTDSRRIKECASPISAAYLGVAVENATSVLADETTGALSVASRAVDTLTSVYRISERPRMICNVYNETGAANVALTKAMVGLQRNMVKHSAGAGVPRGPDIWVLDYGDETATHQIEELVDEVGCYNGRVVVATLRAYRQESP